MVKRKHTDKTLTTNVERLNSLGQESFVSQSALQSILADVKARGLPDSFSRGSQHRARLDLCDTDTPYGPLLTTLDMELKDGKHLDVGCQNPLAFIYYNCEHSPVFRSILKKAFDQKPTTPSNPWNIVLYQDGVDFPDGLGKNKSRHIVIFYYSFEELGDEALCHEEVWGVMVAMRTCKAKTLVGGVPELTYKVVEQFHGETHDILRTGISVLIDASTEYVYIFAKVGMLLCDLPAHAEMISCKGHAATKPCWICMNATHHKPPAGAAPMHLFGDYCKPITETDITKFKKHSNVSLRTGLQTLQGLKGTVSAGELEFREQYVYGFNWSARSILTEARFAIDGIDAAMTDWVHTYVSGGIGDIEFGTFMREMHRSITQDRLQHSCTYRALGEYLSQWRWPKSRGNPMHLFDDEHAKKFIKAGDFGSTSSEFLTIAPIICRFLKNVIEPQTAGTHVEPLVASMIVVLCVIDLLVLQGHGSC